LGDLVFGKTGIARKVSVYKASRAFQCFPKILPKTVFLGESLAFFRFWERFWDVFGEPGAFLGDFWEELCAVNQGGQ